MLIRYFASVIIRNFDIVGIAVDEPEADSPLVVDGNRALSLSVSPELVQSISQRNSQVTQPHGQANVLKFSPCPPHNIWW